VKPTASFPRLHLRTRRWPAGRRSCPLGAWDVCARAIGGRLGIVSDVLLRGVSHMTYAISATTISAGWHRNPQLAAYLRGEAVHCAPVH